MIAINYQKEKNYQKRKLAYKRKNLIKKSHKVLSFVGVNLFDLLFIMHEIIKLLHESILLETATLVIYTIWAYGAHFIHVMFYWLIYLYLWSNVLDLHNVLVVFVVGSPFWRYLIFISFKPLRSIYIKYLYSIIFNIRALVCLIWCLFNY